MSHHYTCQRAVYSRFVGLSKTKAASLEVNYLRTHAGVISRSSTRGASRTQGTICHNAPMHRTCWRGQQAAFMVISAAAVVQQSCGAPQAGRTCSKAPLPRRAGGGQALVERRMVFSGPDAIRDHRTKRPEHTHYIGAISPAIEGSSDANYLWQPASCFSAPLHRRCQYAREIGWGVQELSYFTWRNLQSGAQIKRGQIWQAAEDQATHRYQSPWDVHFKRSYTSSVLQAPEDENKKHMQNLTLSNT
ncbi:uncharacterized protein C4orf45 homolog isoform X2 [Numida meleagris]|uniref:uncharacterized protein C4orf45 homolog isoform X2 n=1 Tax=Numida meleagris TaxID=8996 RepID=UPI000B3D9648|nr:uncharacterized protein C4orf45 homolog isoform X2 [Numida meleagris]